MKDNLICVKCGEIMDNDSIHVPETCDKCGSAVRRVVCCRCGGEWRPMRDTLPKNCTYCKSPYWATARTRRG